MSNNLRAVRPTTPKPACVNIHHKSRDARYIFAEKCHPGTNSVLFLTHREWIVRHIDKNDKPQSAAFIVYLYGLLPAHHLHQPQFVF